VSIRGLIFLISRQTFVAPLQGFCGELTTKPGAALRSAPGYIVAGPSGRQITVDHANGFPVPITSHVQSTGGLQAASGTRRNKN